MTVTMARPHALAAAALTLLLAGCAGAPVRAAGTLTEDEATAAAVRILKGSDYGASLIDVLNRIRQTELMTHGSNDCGPITRPVWAFHLQNPYDGWLYLDAATGEKECSSLPFLR